MCCSLTLPISICKPSCLRFKSFSPQFRVIGGDIKVALGWLYRSREWKLPFLWDRGGGGGRRIVILFIVCQRCFAYEYDNLWFYVDYIRRLLFVFYALFIPIWLPQTKVELRHLNPVKTLLWIFPRYIYFFNKKLPYKMNQPIFCANIVYLE